MGSSYIKIDSISIDLTDAFDKSTSSSDPIRCDEPPFSIRGYVSEIRKKDRKLCWPFPLKDDDDHSELLEQLQSPPPSDLNNSTKNEKENKAQGEKINQDIGVEDPNHQIIPSVPSPEVYEEVGLEGHTNGIGHEGKDVLDVELDTSNDNIIDCTTELPPPELVVCHNTKSGSTNSLVNNEFQDRHPKKSTGLPRKRPQKVRLLTDILRKNSETKTEKATIQGSLSKDTSFPHDKVDVQGDSTKTSQIRRRKFIVDEEQIPEEICFETAEVDLQNLEEEDNTETIDTVSDNVSKDVFGGKGKPNDVESDGCKLEIERSHTVDRKKNKKVFVDNHLISEPLKMKQKRSQDNKDFANDVSGLKNTSRLVPAITEKGVNKFPVPNMTVTTPIHSAEGALKENNLEERRHLSQDSFSHRRSKVMPNMNVTAPVHSAEGALNEKHLKEGLNLSLNSHLATHAYNKRRIHQLGNQAFSLPFPGVTSAAHQFTREEREAHDVGEPVIPLKRDDISGNRVFYEEDGDQAADEESEKESEDDVPMDIVEFMARNQYERERGLPDGQKKRPQMIVGNSVNDKEEQSLLQEDQKEKNGVIIGGQNARSHKGNSVHGYYSLDSYQLKMNNLHQTQSPFEIQASQHQMNPSSGFQFPPVSSSQFSGAQNRSFNGNSADRGSSGATRLQAQGRYGLQDPILQQDDKASHMWGSLTPNQVSLGYDMFRSKVVSQDVQRQNIKRDIDLNYINLTPSDHEKLNRKSASGAFSRMNPEYSFPCKYSEGIEAHQNIRGSHHLYSNEMIPTMHLFNLMDAKKQPGTPFNVTASSNANLVIGAPKASFDSLKRPSSDHYGKSYNLSEKSHGCFLGFPTFGASSSIQLDDKFSDKMGSSNSGIHHKDNNNKQYIWAGLEKETSRQRQPEVHDACGTLVPLKNSSSGSITCSINRNPPDFTMSEAENVYMIKGQDLKLEKASVSGNKPDLLALPSSRQRKNSKPSKLKEHVRH